MAEQIPHTVAGFRASGAIGLAIPRCRCGYRAQSFSWQYLGALNHETIDAVAERARCSGCGGTWPTVGDVVGYGAHENGAPAKAGAP